MFKKNKKMWKTLLNLKFWIPVLLIGIGVGIAFEMIKNIMDMVDHVLVMTVNPGFGGQAYIPTMLNKIREIKRKKRLYDSNKKIHEKKMAIKKMAINYHLS